ncbi:MAG: AMP-binding protein [Oscillospiraceae bacterium]|jgi:long-chain acyl-CoA synthetase|nr:AMP-binding protein [Oscillospiraceae bacterium]
MALNTPWLKHYGNVPQTLDYPEGGVTDLVLKAAKKYPENTATEFNGSHLNYSGLVAEIRRVARAFHTVGIKSDDRVAICLPNTPQAVFAFYGLNMIGAISVMIHPQSSPEELVYCLNESECTAVVTLDVFEPKFAAIMPRLGIKMLILTAIEDGLSMMRSTLFALTQGRKSAKTPLSERAIRWREVLRRGDAMNFGAPPRLDSTMKEPLLPYEAPIYAEEVATILFTGGTCGKPRGVKLTNLAINALALQTAAASDCIVPGHKMLAIMPIFHGFGLGVCIHTALTSGLECVLVPQFSVKSFAELLKKHHPNYVAGVPTLFEALLRMEDADRLDLSGLEGVFSGGDTLPADLKRRVDEFLKKHGSHVQIREGYGLTECVTASCLTPREFHREGSIGIPFPDTYYKIVEPGTSVEVATNKTGEICVSGPTVMAGYDGDDGDTADVLRQHGDGRVWLHTGDLGAMD